MNHSDDCNNWVQFHTTSTHIFAQLCKERPMCGLHGLHQFLACVQTATHSLHLCARGLFTLCLLHFSVSPQYKFNAGFITIQQLLNDDVLLTDNVL